ncbi:hypothetical protein BGAFAR04_Ab0084 (plasmid) [Borreliella garinii Far04]|nr:hypothetical protein BGAFAR04_Ab0084 [Borreliella garinii Far04]
METLESKAQKIELDKTAKKTINIYKLKKTLTFMINVVLYFYS